MKETGLTQEQIKRWFANKRRYRPKLTSEDPYRSITDNEKSVIKNTLELSQWRDISNTISDLEKLFNLKRYGWWTFEIYIEGFFLL